MKIKIMLTFEVKNAEYRQVEIKTVKLPDNAVLNDTSSLTLPIFTNERYSPC